MPSYQPPKKNTQFVFYAGLRSQANTKIFQSAPTLAAGDFKVTTDGGALANLGTLPTNTPGAQSVKFTLSAAEMNGDNVTVICSDAAGSEWCDLIVNIQSSTRQIDDLATPTNITAGTITTVSGNVTGSVGSIAGTIGTFDALNTALSLAHGAGSWLTGSTLDAAGVRAAVGLAAANLDTQLAAIGTATTALATTLEFVGPSYRFTAAALALGPTGTALTSQQVRDAMKLAATAGAAAADSVDDYLSDIRLKTDLIVVGGITVTSPVDVVAETITMIQGDDYKAADGRAISLTSSDWPSLTGGTVKLRVGGSIDYTFTVSSATTVTRDFTSAETGALAEGNYDYQLIATLLNGDAVTLSQGGFIIAKRVPAA